MSDQEMQLRIVNGCYTMVPVEEPVKAEEPKVEAPVEPANIKRGRPRKE